MRTTVALTLIAGALSAPTRTLNNRQFDFDSLASLLPKPSGGSGGFDLGDLFDDSPSASPSSSPGGSSGLGGSGGLPGLPGLGGSGSGGSGLGDLFGGSSGSDSGSSSPSAPEPSSSSGGSSGLGGLPGLGGSGAGGSSSSSDVTDNSGCKALTFIFARGTTEIGTMGTVVGPKVADELDSQTGGKVAVQGVDYPADAAGNAQLGASGGPEMAKLVKQAVQQCPDTKVVLGGYSQGAMVVHNAAGKLSSGQVVGAVTFGDPFKAQKPDNIEQFKTWCATGDPVCANGANVMAHLTYGGDAAEAAKFLVNAAGL
ncbi:cutinase-domain-containing protein [Aspergillus aurantiobrunneus]